MTHHTIDTAVDTLPLWAVVDYGGPYIHVRPIAGWLRVTCDDDRVRIVPARWAARMGTLAPTRPMPASVHHTREEAEKAADALREARRRYSLHVMQRAVADVQRVDEKIARTAELILAWLREQDGPQPPHAIRTNSSSSKLRRRFYRDEALARLVADGRVVTVIDDAGETRYAPRAGV